MTDAGTPPPGPWTAPVPVGPASREPHLGLVSLVAAIGALAVSFILSVTAALRIGVGVGARWAWRPHSMQFDLRILEHVREWIALGEYTLLFGSAVGIWALVQGILSIVTGRGREYGIAAVMIAGVAPLLLLLAVAISLRAGLTAATGFAR